MAEFGRWRIGEGGINPIDIRIIGAIHVSAGSWMPILQLCDVWIFSSHPIAARDNSQLLDTL